MDVGSGLLLFFIGSIVTVLFFSLWFKAMEHQEKERGLLKKGVDNDDES